MCYGRPLYELAVCEGHGTLLSGSAERCASEDYDDHDPTAVLPTMGDGHRPLRPRVCFPESLLVARPVKRAEAESSPEAQAALRKEWDRLRNIKGWMEDQVVEGGGGL